MADADLVLEGGGVKGSALAGAIAALEGAPSPYTFHRVAGTSAGAIVASFLAAGMSSSQIREVLNELDFSRFQDRKGLLSRVPVLGPGLGLLLHQGLYAGEFLHDWISRTLAAEGVRTWGDLRMDDPGSALPRAQRYRLVVIVSDVSRGLMLRLPWDYRQLMGVDPDSIPVADAIRASASVPFFFHPWRMPMNPRVTGHDRIVCVDGGLLSNFPIDVFDRHDGQAARWPTLGVKLSGHQSLRSQDWNPEHNSVQFSWSLLHTLMSAQERTHINDPAIRARTIFVDTSPYRPTDFSLGQEDKQILYQSGMKAAQQFLRRWDWADWKRRFHG
ncbi:patatin-like phospholipase family protein [Arthrobacter sp. NPDC090010]|uniref:patatin-like phospholipase family protein n=1 Tax=Arthrobacter sp. NPDC090010 TaxID=3363942 RepID=UPI00380149CC